MLADEKGKLDRRARAAQDGAVAWSAGKTVRARDDKGAVRSWDAPSSVRGLAFVPKGYRLAVRHYNGVSLWFPNADADAGRAGMEGLASRRHLVARRRFWSPSMQENTLHGWRLADKKDMRMTGYPVQDALLLVVA